MRPKLERLAVGAILAALAALSSANVPRGTEVRLMLVKNLNSGGSVLGEAVPFLIAEDVRIHGEVAIREGTLAVGVIKQVRREGAFSATVFDKPARLAVEIMHTWDVYGREVRLAGRLNGKQRELIHFNRDNTKVSPIEDEEQASLLNDPNKWQIIDRLVSTLKGSRSIAELGSNAQRGVIMEVARALRLESTVDLLLNNRIMDLVTLGSKLSTPSIAALMAARAAFDTATVAVKAVKEVASIACHMPGFLSRKFGGRNINAPAGLELSVFVN